MCEFPRIVARMETSLIFCTLKLEGPLNFYNNGLEAGLKPSVLQWTGILYMGEGPSTL